MTLLNQTGSPKRHTKLDAFAHLLEPNSFTRVFATCSRLFLTLGDLWHTSIICDCSRAHSIEAARKH